MSNEYDVIVVGSGFGGSVTACRLAQAGRKVLVLERGREWDKSDYPRSPDDAWVWDEHAPEERNGWIDLRVFGDMIVAQGAGVGGGSLIYANIFVEAQPWVFESGWPAAITYDRLSPHYESTGRMLGVQELPDNQLTERFKLMRDGAEAIGAGDRFRKLPLAVTFDDDFRYDRDDPHNPSHSRSWVNPQGRSQGTCIHCGNCDIGCPVHAKNTLDLNYLAAATAAGAEIRALHRVRGIAPTDDGYEVQFDDISSGRRVPGSVTGTRVVLAAGSLGSTELLLRARDEQRTLPQVSARLGHGWSSNGDFLTPAVYANRRVSPTRGPTITCAIDFLDGSRGGHRFFVEDGGFPNVVGNTIGDLAATASHVGGVYGAVFSALARLNRASDPVDCVMPWFGQAADAADGRLYLGQSLLHPFGDTELKLDWDIDASEAIVQALVDAHKELSQATGGVAMEPVTWSWMKDLITPHPLGGCAMADTPEHGVVNGDGEVFGHPGLYVADSAIFPKAVGLNPSRTIAALAEHIAERMIAD